MEKNQPEKKYTAGAISATIWHNQAMKDNQAVSFRTVTFDRRYKDKSGEWKSTNQLRVQDLPKAVLVLNKAYEFLNLRNNLDE